MTQAAPSDEESCGDSKKPQSLINHQHSLFSTSRDPAFLGYMNVTKFWPRKVGDGRIATREVRGRGKPLR